MIGKMHIENFKCFKDFDIELGPFNVLVGPNDSGKTAFLQAVQLASLLTQPKGRADLPERLHALLARATASEWYWRGKPKGCEIRFEIAATAAGAPKILRIFLRGQRLVAVFGPEVEGESIEKGRGDLTGLSTNVIRQRDEKATKWFQQVIGDSCYARLNPDVMREPSPISRPGREPDFYLGPGGESFPTLLEDILRADRRAFAEMENAFYKRFPHYTGVRLPKQDSNNTLIFETHGTSLGAGHVSDGAILYLGYLALAYQASPPKVMLIEEPENGVHHASLEEIVTTLRKLPEDAGSQVIVTTHSPYLLDCVAPEEVRVFWKDEEGAVHAVKLSDLPDIQDMRKLFNAGEIWTAFTEEQIVEQAGGGK